MLSSKDYSNYEVVLVDDCSKDDSYEKLLEKSASHPNFKVVQPPKNGGPGPARNFGISNASGKYILFCDSDDIFDITCLPKIDEFLQRYPDADIVASPHLLDRSQKETFADNYSKYKKDPDFDVAEFRKSLGLNENDFVVASVGELNKNKNTLRLIDAMKNVKNPNVKYLICGDGVLREEYQSKIKENNLQDRCLFLGYRKDIQKILNVIDCYVMPSYREGLSKAMMEAMNYSLPIIASNIRGNKDLVGDNEGGILVNPKSTEEFTKAIEDLSCNPNQAKIYGERNREFVQNFSIEKVISQMKEIYEEI
jgi:glycosyltransferase involved in cell wall biosynthesis